MDSHVKRNGQIIIEILYITLLVASFTVVAQKMNTSWIKKHKEHQFNKIETKNGKIRFLK